jgi:hypothetical protein
MPLPYRRLPLSKRMSGTTHEVFGPADRFNTLEHSRHCLQALCFLPRQQSAARNVVSKPPISALAHLGLRKTAAPHRIMTGLHDLHVTPQQRPPVDLQPIPRKGWKGRGAALGISRSGCLRIGEGMPGAGLADVLASRHCIRRPGQSKALPRMNALLAFPNSTRLSIWIE